MKSALFLLRRPPFQGLAPLEIIDTLLVAAAFDVPTCVLFLGDGVWQLVSDGAAESQGLKDPAKPLAALPLYDVEALYVDAAALRRYGLSRDRLNLPVTTLEPSEIGHLIASCELIFND